MLKQISQRTICFPKFTISGENEIEIEIEHPPDDSNYLPISKRYKAIGDLFKDLLNIDGIDITSNIPFGLHSHQGIYMIYGDSMISPMFLIKHTIRELLIIYPDDEFLKDIFNGEIDISISILYAHHLHINFLMNIGSNPEILS